MDKEAVTRFAGEEWQDKVAGLLAELVEQGLYGIVVTEVHSLAESLLLLTGPLPTAGRGGLAAQPTGLRGLPPVGAAQVSRLPGAASIGPYDIPPVFTVFNVITVLLTVFLTVLNLLSLQGMALITTDQLLLWVHTDMVRCQNCKPPLEAPTSLPGVPPGSVPPGPTWL